MNFGISSRPTYINNAINHLQERIDDLNNTYQRRLGSCFFSAARNRAKQNMLTQLKTDLESSEFYFIENNSDLEKIGFTKPQIKELYKGFFSHKTEATMQFVFQELQQTANDNFAFTRISNDLKRIILNDKLSENEVIDKFYIKLLIAFEKIHVKFVKGTLAFRIAEKLHTETNKAQKENNPRMPFMKTFLWNLSSRIKQKYAPTLCEKFVLFLEEIQGNYRDEFCKTEIYRSRYLTYPGTTNTPKKVYSFKISPNPSAESKEESKSKEVIYAHSSPLINHLKTNSRCSSPLLLNTKSETNLPYLNFPSPLSSEISSPSHPPILTS